MDLNNIINNDEKETKTSCDRCASCCTGGGPILRIADAYLVKTGKIPSNYLYTLRKGELLFDKDKLEMVPIKTDLIKIKINKETLKCLFLEDKNHCKIYGMRPSECRAFKCWNTREIEAKYHEDPLERADLLSDLEGMWELIVDHQERCSYEKMKELTEELEDDEDGHIFAEINEIVKYDNALRQTMVEKAGVDPEMLHFLIGRPFTETMAMFNYIIEEKDGNYLLKPVE